MSGPGSFGALGGIGGIGQANLRQPEAVQVSSVGASVLGEAESLVEYAQQLAIRLLRLGEQMGSDAATKRQAQVADKSAPAPPPQGLLPKLVSSQLLLRERLNACERFLSDVEELVR